MISIPRSVDSAHSAFASLRVSSHPRKRGVLAVLCLALATMLCGAGQNALAQTAYFSGAQTVLSGGFNGPEDVAVDASGNVYVADTNNGGVDEILSSGGYTTKRTLVSDPDYFPVAVAVDGSGNVYFSDNYPPVVYLVELMAVNGSIPISATPSFLSHAIETLLDNTYDFPSGMAVDGSGNVYMPYYNYVLEYLASSGGETGWGGPFNRTIGLALDASGNIYVADRGNHAVYEILAVNGSVPASPTINTLASGFSFPWGVAVDASGNVYVADNGNNVVDEILAVNGSIPASPTILTLGSGFNQPAGLAMDGSGNLYVADSGRNSVERIALSVVDFGAKNIGAASPAISLLFTFTTGGNIGAPAVLTEGAPYKDFTDAGSGSCTTNGTGYVYNAGDSCTVDVIFTPRFAGTRFGAAVLTDSSGNVIATGYLQGAGVGPQVSFPPGTQSAIGSGMVGQWGDAVDGAGNVYIVNQVPGTVYKETPSLGGYTQSTVVSGLFLPAGIAVDGAGNVYICDSGNNRVLMETLLPSGSYAQSTVGSGLSTPAAVVVDGSGNVYISDYGNLRVLKETLSSGGYTQSTIVSGSTPAHSIPALGIAVDGNGNVYLAYHETPTLFKETPSSSGGYIESTFGNGLRAPVGIAVDGIGNVYVADGGAATVYKETLLSGSYTQSVVANTLTPTERLAPYGVAVDGSGNVFISGMGSSTALKLDFADAPGLSFATAVYGSTSSDSPQTVTVQNNGNAALSFPVPSSGSNPSIAASFTLDSDGASACPLVEAGSGAAGTLAAGASCQLSIGFVPAGVGALSGSLMLTDNHLNAAAPGYATQSIALSGTGTQAAQTINFGAQTSPVMYGTGPVVLSATATSGLSVTFSVVSGPGTITGSALTITGVGTVVVAANQVGNTNYAAAAAVQQSITVNQASQTVSFALPSPVTYGVGPIELSAIGGASGNPVTFSVVSGPGTITGSALTITGAGTVVIAANQAGNTNYAAAAAAQQSITVNQASQTVSFILPSPVIYGVGPIELSATGGASGNPVTFSVVSGPGTIGGGMLTITGAGKVVVAANQAGNTNYAAAATMQQSITVNQASQTVSFPLPSPVTYGVGPIELSATGGASGNPVTFSVVSGPGSITGSALTITGAGTVVVAANQAGNADYAAAATVQQSITVNQALPVVEVVSSANLALMQNTVTLQATVLSAVGTPTGTVTFMDGSTTLGSGTLTGGVAALTTSNLSVGSHTITAVYGGDTNFAALASGALTLVVEDFSLNLSAAGGSYTQTVTPGQTATFMFTIGPSGGTTFPTAVTFAIDGVPAGAMASFSPSSLPAGSSSTTVTLTIQAPVTTTMLHRENRPGNSVPPVLWGILLLPFTARLRRAGKRLGGKLSVLLLFAAACAAMAGVSGCGGSSSSTKSYTMTVTAISGSLAHSTTVTLMVE